MKAQIILRDHSVNVELNEPVIKVSAQPKGFSVQVIGGVGPQGPQGYSPIRGVDYWTDADQAILAQAAIDRVLAIYPAAEEVQW